MKKILSILVLVFSVVLINAQTATITIPDAWTDASSANLDQLTEWVVKGELTGRPGSKKYYISDTWNPSNTDLNAINTAGGNIENYQFYFNVTDTNFFYSPVSSLMDKNTIGIKSFTNAPLKVWGEYLNQSHVIYYVAAQTKFWIAATDSEGNFLDLNTVVSIKNTESYISAYVTQAAVNANSTKVQRKSDGTTWQ